MEEEKSKVPYLLQPLLYIKRLFKFPKSIWSRLFILVAFLQACAIIPLQVIITIDRVNQVTSYQTDETLESRSIITYNSLFICAQFFSIILCWDAVTRKNTIQVILATFFNYSEILHATIVYDRYKGIGPESTTYLDLSVIVIIISCSVAYSALAWELFLEFGWKVFKKLGADLIIRRMYMAHQILVTLLRLLIFFFIAYSVQLAALVLSVDDVETWIQIALVIPGSVVVLFLCFYSLQREHKSLMLFVITIFVIAIGYFIYMFYRIFRSLNTPNDPFVDSRKYLASFSAITLLLIFLVLINSIVCYRNFGQGLKESILRYQQRKYTLASQGLDYHDDVRVWHTTESRERWQLD